MMQGVYVAIYLCGFFISCLIGASKGRGAQGLFVGFLSWLGVVIMLLARPTAEFHQRQPCPFCGEAILKIATVCPRCRRTVAPLKPAPHGTPEGWYADPSGRYPESRWWDGSAWSQWVRDKPGGIRRRDPPVRS
jgi:hypothetical protein